MNLYRVMAADAILHDLLIELECPICTDYMSPPIRQCTTGHSICENCRKKLHKCALCRGMFTDSRNISLEGLAIKMRYPCINNAVGCEAMLTFAERKTHELRCTMKGYKCPMETCLWTGKLEDIAVHWASKKNTCPPYTRSNICHTKLKADSYYVNIVNAYEKNFWFKYKVTNNKIYWAVQYIGNAIEAESHYSYEVNIFAPGRPLRKIMIGDECQAIDLENSKLFRDDVCISLHTNTLRDFLSAGQVLVYHFRINATQKPFYQDAFNTPARGIANVCEGAPRKQQRDRCKRPIAKGRTYF